MIENKRPHVAVLLACLLLLGDGVAAVPENERRPLLMEGKKTLFQRVLTRPGARLHSDPTPSGEVLPAVLPPFSVYYVFDRKIIDGSEWLELGARQTGSTQGWVEASQAVDWKQTLTVAFTNPAGREPILFFKNGTELLNLLESETLVPESDRLRTTIDSGNLPEDFPVISIEPKTYVDFEEEFYLLPILSAEEVWLSSGFKVRMIELASVPRQEGERQDTVDDPQVRQGITSTEASISDAIRGYRTAITFVIDTTISMQPYIDAARDAVRRIYNGIKEAGLLNKVNFALVGFRDHLAASPELEYVSKVFADLQTGSDPEAFVAQVADAKEASVSSKGFIEDAYAGLLLAMDRLAWDEYGGRIIVLITDAGARAANDPLGETKMGAEQIRRLALDKGIALYTLHLLTREGRPNHRSARVQYEVLSDFQSVGNIGSLYFPIDAGSVRQNELLVGKIADELVKMVADASQGMLVKPVSEAPQGEEIAPNGGGDSAGDGQAGGGDVDEAQIREAVRKTNLVGHVMQLAYLGRTTGVRAPRLFRAWAVDRDLANPDAATLEVRVLLTKNQLSDLYETLRRILEAGETAQFGSTDFFNQIQSAAAAMGRDPSRVGREGTRDLAGLRLMGEYLDDLPYQSKVTSIPLDHWREMGVGEQQAFIDEIKAKMKLYETYHDREWIPLVAGGDPGDEVFPVPLEALP